MKNPWPIKLLAYALLLAGAVVFSFPFVWMAATSAKVDRELMSTELRVMPQMPDPRPRSPYIDPRLHARLQGPHQPLLLPYLGQLVGDSGIDIPKELDTSLAIEHTARGLYTRLRTLIPDDAWDGKAAASPDQTIDRLRELARRRVTPDLVSETLAQVHRELRLGPMRARSDALQEQELGAGNPVSSRWTIANPHAARLVDLPSPTPLAALHYDFTADGKPIVLTRDVQLDFPVQQLQRLQLELRPDDTFHDLWLTIEHSGKVFRARRSMVLLDYNPINLMWRPASDDDHSTKIKTWVVLDPVEGAVSDVVAPQALRVTLELRQAYLTKAIANKLAANYIKVADYMPFWRYLRVSLFLVIASVTLTVFASSFVAYAFARLNWPGREFCFLVMLATMMIPSQVTMIPHFLIWKNLGAYNTLTPLWLGAVFGNAFYIFLLRQFLRGIPRDLEDAARIDGCGFLRTYWHVMLPLIKPSLAAIAIFTFMATWNDFLGPLIYVADQRLYPLAFGLYAFTVQVGANNATLTMAAALVMTLPVILIFFFAQKYFIQGITLTGMKG